MTSPESVILVDTSVLIDLLQGGKTTEAMFLEWLIRENRGLIRITDLSYMEIISGLKSEASAREVVEALNEFITVSPSGVKIMVEAANNYRSLRHQGITVRSMIDCLIATLAISNNWFLLHRDRDFAPFEQTLGLKNPL